MINSKFYKLFSDEDACMNHFKALKEKHMVCPERGHSEFKWIPYRKAHQCCHCGKRIPLRKNTMLERSKLPYNYWYAAVHLLTTMKLSVSAKEVQRQLGHKFYQPIWELCHKIKDVMGRYDNRQKLKGTIEVDEAFFTCYTPAELKNKLLTRGSGSERKEKVVVMAESEFPDKPKKGGKIKALHHVRMVRVDDLKKDSLNRVIVRNLGKESVIISDASSSHDDFRRFCKEVVSKVIKPEEMDFFMPWVHTVISNTKRMLDAVHHGIMKDYLQYYLDMASYKINRGTENIDPFYPLMDFAVVQQTGFTSRDYPLAKQYNLFYEF